MELTENININLPPIPKRMTPRVYRIYEFLKMRCVGRENGMNSQDLCNTLKTFYPEVFKPNYAPQILREDIRKLRTFFDRRVGSHPKYGYWLVVDDDGNLGTEYNVKNCLTMITTLVNLGVPKEAFYKHLNGLKNNSLANEQVRIDGNIVMTHSDDLLSEEK